MTSFLRPRRSAFGLVGIVLVGAAACGGHSVIGAQTGAGGGAGQGTGGAGGSAGRSGAGGSGGSAGAGNSAGTGNYAGTGNSAGAAGSDGCPVGVGAPPDAGVAFPTVVEYTTNRGSFLVGLGDLNGDGKPDLVVVNSSAMDPISAGGATGSGTGGTQGAAGATGAGGLGPGSLSVFLSGANAGLTGPQNYLAGTSPNSIAVGDLNGDGKADVAVTDNYQELGVLFSSGNGTLLPPVSFATGTRPTSVAIGDLNGDGKADLAVANMGNGNGSPGPSSEVDGDVAVLLNMGSGTFIAANYPTGPNPYFVAIGDLNGDGKADLVLANKPNVSVLLNKGDGTFGAAVSYGVGTNAFSVAIGDLNGDGKPDLVVTNGSVGGASVLLNAGNGTFAAAVNYAYSGTFISSVTIGDLNGDGRPDVAAPILYSTSPCNLVAVWLNGGNGTLGEPFSLDVGQSSASGSGPVDITDLNGDGKLDLIVPNGVGVGVFLNAGH
jgi:hypothetical protein